jgi:YVTN family beta-propeller protein
VIAALTTLLVAAIAIPLLDSRGSASTVIASNSVGVLDPDTGELLGTPLGFDDRPGSIAASEDAVWVTHPDAGTVTRIDPSEREVRDSIPVGANPTGIAVGFGAVWVVESGGPSVSRISPDTNDVVDRIVVGNGPAGVAVGEGSVWVTNRFDGTISRIDPSGAKAVETIPVGLDPEGIAVGFGSVWVGLAGSSKVVRVDPRTDSVTQQIGVGNGPGSLTVSTDTVLVVNSLDDTVSFLLFQVGSKVAGAASADYQTIGINLLSARVLITLLSGSATVGALTSKDFRFTMRAWELYTTPSVCPGL